ncbi:type II secretion system protein [Deinococcus sp. SL84]|uniref:type II secretion system protein n=1 Tax=Deinococcus sp. SL84 TaxID=2994663 RepID=UPI002273EEEC|nr:type II secretion system protein [Deinococcus sp. SL84]MCY1703398.1 type II secretion system protein [Deinococcus sp. SL84]
MMDHIQQNRVSRGPKQAGFTLVELLVAIALFAILIAVISSTMIGILGVNGKSQQRLASTSKVQQVVESVKASWSPPSVKSTEALDKVKANYGNICVEMQGALPAGTTVQVQGLDKRGGSAGSVANVVFKQPGACSATVPSGLPDMRRVTVKSTDAEGKAVTIVLDIVNPGRL